MEKDYGFCFKHPDIPASAECRECGAPICQTCIVRSTEGKAVFCSTACRDSFYAYQQWLSESGVNPLRPRFSLWAWIKHLTEIFCLLLIIWGALWFATGKVRIADQFRFFLDMIMAFI